jgi:hypothetical protein
MPPKERRGSITSRSGTADTKSSSSAAKSSHSLARKVVIREASKKGQVDPSPDSDSPPSAPQARSAVPGERRKGKQAVPGEGVTNYLARANAEDDAANKGEDVLPTSLELTAKSTATTITPQQQNRSSRSSYGEESVSPSTEEGYPDIDISIHLGTESMRDSMSHQSATTGSPRESLKRTRGKKAPAPEELRKLQYQEQFLLLDNLRDYVDNSSFSDRESIEHTVKSGQIPMVEQKLALLHAEHRVTIALNEHQILLEEAQYKPRSKIMSSAEDWLTAAVDCLNPDTKGGLSQHAQVDAGVTMPRIFVRLARVYHDITAANAMLLVEAHQWRLLEAWIENKSERLKYQPGDTLSEFDDMYISPRILKEGACHILQNLLHLNSTWKETLKNMKTIAKKAGVGIDQFQDDSMARKFLKFAPTGHYDFFRMGFSDIRCGNFEGHGDPRFSWDIQTFLKSLALRAMSVHQMRDCIDTFELNCQKALDISEGDDLSECESKFSN